MAMDDELIRRNPFAFELATVLKNDGHKREALTMEQMNSLLEFIKNDKHYSRYYGGIYILFHTGLRISEFCGLTKKDIDFQNHCIHVDHQLVRYSDMIYRVEVTKTENGVRDVTMTRGVEEAFRSILKNRKRPKAEPIIDRHTGFLFLDKNDMPLLALHWQKYFHFIMENYNETHRIVMPKVTPHVCRYTFCSNMAKTGMNPKMLQYIMGHGDISVTLNTYTHVKYEDALAELKRVGVV